MKVKNISKHVIVIEAQVLSDNLIKNFLEIINDCSDDIRSLMSQVNAFSEALQDAKTDRWYNLFSQGYTMMMLPAQEMKFVEDYFAKKEKSDHKEVFKNDELVLEIVHNDHVVCIVDEEQIDY